VEEVKPWVDSTYSTWGDTAHTFIMGSSCGGLISSYAFCRYPEVFGGAGCLSTHSSLMNPYVATSQKPAAETYLEYLNQNLPADSEHLLYMDRGDCQIDSAYAESQEAINDMITALDWNKDNYMYRFFPGQSHSENDWRSRLDIPVRFLLGK
jgi:enterochelin esterase-like enzyme